jgi:hypothetical protein
VKRAEIGELLAEVDSDGSGEVEYPEFIEVMTSTLAKLAEKKEQEGSACNQVRLQGIHGRCDGAGVCVCVSCSAAFCAGGASITRELHAGRQRVSCAISSCRAEGSQLYSMTAVAPVLPRALYVSAAAAATLLLHSYASGVAGTGRGWCAASSAAVCACRMPEACGANSMHAQRSAAAGSMSVCHSLPAD